MSAVIACFNNKSGPGQTTLIYHLGHILAELGHSVVLLDLDPQAALTAMCLSDEQQEDIWPDAPEHPRTVMGCLEPALRGQANIPPPVLIDIADRLSLLPGDLSLSRFEDMLADAWSCALAGESSALTTLSAFHQIARHAAGQTEARFILMDVGATLGPMTRAALLTADHILLPLAPDRFAIEGLRTLGPTLDRWRQGWAERRACHPDVDAPQGWLNLLGYFVIQPPVRLDRPFAHPERWFGRIPEAYLQAAGGGAASPLPPEADPACMGIMRQAPGLMALALEAQKPMFLLRPADGALGALMNAVAQSREDFRRLAEALQNRLNAAEHG